MKPKIKTKYWLILLSIVTAILLFISLSQYNQISKLERTIDKDKDIISELKYTTGKKYRYGLTLLVKDNNSEQQIESLEYFIKEIYPEADIVSSKPQLDDEKIVALGFDIKAKNNDEVLDIVDQIKEKTSELSNIEITIIP